MSSVIIGRHADDSRTPLLKRSVAQPASRKHAISLLLQDWWLWEIISALTAIAATTAIILILVFFDSSSLPDWPSVITINSVISFFSVITKLAITSAVGALISQSKWLWYRQDEPHSLNDLQSFEDASRGPWGAVALLFSIRARHWTMIGAMITIMLLLFDPFIQQIVIYPTRLVASTRAATIVRAQNYVAQSEEGLPLPSVVDMSMKAAIYNGIFDISNQANLNVEHDCPTSNCTWQDFSSLAVCSTCANITSYIKKSCNATECQKISLPGGPSLTGFGRQINSSATKISSSLANIEPSVLQFSSLVSKGKSDFNNAIAWECALFYCINTYTASVTDGLFQQSVEKTWRNDSATNLLDSDLLYSPPHSIVNITANVSTCRVSSLAARTLNDFMTATFTGIGVVDVRSTSPMFSSDVIHALYSTTNYSGRIENLVISMTNNIRQRSDSGLPPFNGEAMIAETYVHVRWVWFTYPATVIALVLVYLIGTLIETTYRDVLIWKSSSLAVLFHGQNLKLEHADRVSVRTVSEMSEKARNVKVKLVQELDEDWKLVQR